MDSYFNLQISNPRLKQRSSKGSSISRGSENSLLDYPNADGINNISAAACTTDAANNGIQNAGVLPKKKLHGILLLMIGLVTLFCITSLDYNFKTISAYAPTGLQLQSVTSETFMHTWNGVTTARSYGLLRPASGNPPTAAVVILFGGCDDLSMLRQANDYLVVCPEPRAGRDWQAFSADGDDAEDSDFIEKLITQRLEQSPLNVPPKRTIVTGFSFGGSMAYRTLCDRSSAIGGIVPFAQAFLEPASGHLPKDVDFGRLSQTDFAMRGNNANYVNFNEVRSRGLGCVVAGDSRVPHRAIVGTADGYYGEVAGGYKGKQLWEYLSTNVFGCTGTISNVSGVEARNITGRRGSVCYNYPICAGLSNGNLNQYCTVQGMEHSTSGWDAVIGNALRDFFPDDAASPVPTPQPAPTPSPMPSPVIPGGAACCQAMNAQCLSCAAGLSVEEYCKSNPSTQGCNTNNESPSNPSIPEICCKAMTADCLACAEGVSVERYCQLKPATMGCGTSGKSGNGGSSGGRGKGGSGRSGKGGSDKDGSGTGSNKDGSSTSGKEGSGKPSENSGGDKSGSKDNGALGGNMRGGDERGKDGSVEVQNGGCGCFR